MGTSCMSEASSPVAQPKVSSVSSGPPNVCVHIHQSLLGNPLTVANPTPAAEIHRVSICNPNSFLHG